MPNLRVRNFAFGVFWCALFLLALLIPINVLMESVHAVTPTLTVAPSLTTVGVGQNFSIDIAVAGVANLYGWEIRLGWNATLLDEADTVEGPFLKSHGGTFFTYSVNQTEGRVVADCSLLGFAPGVNGSGTLATLTFRVKSSGECTLDLFNTSLINAFEQPITDQEVDGYWRSAPPHNIAVTYVAFSPAITLPGSIVNVNVSVQNNGDFAESFNVTAYANLALIGLQPVVLNSGSSTIVPFAWNTTGCPKGDYIMSASATVVPGETETADNTRVAGSPVTILTYGHDVAVIRIQSAKTVVGQGYSANINVTVKNYGVFTETFNTTLHLEAIQLQPQTSTAESGKSVNLVFVWNTATAARGNYTLSAYASVVPGETATSDNMLVGGKIVVAIPGDLNGDGTVDVFDATILSVAYGSTPDSLYWNASADINNDGIVDVFDAIIISADYGQTS